MQRFVECAACEAECGGSLVLLVASGTLVASMRSFGSTAPGLETRQLVVASLGLAAPGRVPPELAKARATFAARVTKLSDVTAAARALYAPYTSWYPLLTVAPQGSKVYRRLQYNAVTPNYFGVLYQAIRGGRAFDAADSAADADVAIVSAQAARVLWPASVALGQTLRIARSRDEPDRLVRVIGVVADAHSGMLWDNDDFGYVYLPASAKDFATSDMPLLVRADDPAVVTRAIQDVARQVDANAPLIIAPAQSARELMLMPIRYGTWITSAVGALGLGLALIGLYGVVSFAVLQRRRDIAVHVAMGALPRDVMRLVLSRELRLVTIGLAVGLALASGESRLIAAWVVPLTSLGVTAFGAVALALFAVAFVASLMPALAALRISPASILRQE